MDDRLQQAMDEVAALNETHGVTMRGGKRYVEVKYRVDAWRRAFGIDSSIQTTILENDGAKVLCQAMVYLEGKVIGVGHSEKRHGEGHIAAKVELAETAAIGRALSACGLCGGEYASANEMDEVPKQPVPPKTPPPKKKVSKKAPPKKTAEKVLPAQPDPECYRQIKKGIVAVKGDEERLNKCLDVLLEKVSVGALATVQYNELYILTLIELGSLEQADKELENERGQSLPNDTRKELRDWLGLKHTP